MQVAPVRPRTAAIRTVCMQRLADVTATRITDETNPTKVTTIAVIGHGYYITRHLNRHHGSSMFRFRERERETGC